ncbi:CGNR zinc finger domain-containing protein [Rhizobium sp. C4]|uniref:CGNR zinc finger domain-containing protein n=1 Tax=Rhizobium sp. C4 TaxID=1349800 RepID=UPI001E50B973|nr:CGNR zinc finger domain-containing protein [Rhizobium sp. C4]MCD2171831.1 CGNR zinc finger domain-containing protein [Rhizobium sp. C4]
MAFSWTHHRFSGGALALDVANSVILRFDPARSIDRFADPANLEAFPEAATRLCLEQPAQALSPLPVGRVASLIALREAIDRHFRAEAKGVPSALLLADLLEEIARALRAGQSGDLDFETAMSALRLVSPSRSAALKICPNCEWLFLDRSKNRSRAWCDMAVCGNRAKARLHYHRKRQEKNAS